MKDGISSDTVIMFGLGTALIGAIVYAVYSLSDKLDASTAAINQAGAAGQGVAGQIGGASGSAEDVAAQIYNANQSIQQIQQSDAYTGANKIGVWLNQ
jgi:hypothetical protein